LVLESTQKVSAHI